MPRSPGYSMGRLGFASNAPAAAGCGHTCHRPYTSVHSLQTRGGCCYKPRVCHWCIQCH
uniref:Vacuolar protein sorting-associated protein 29 n=1 Tax=Rhizophora mucronata TaxID=61149 RepID=A0A2P2MK50_RHIMU